MSTLITRVGMFKAVIAIDDAEDTVEVSFATPDNDDYTLPYEMRSTFMQHHDGTPEGKASTMTFLLGILAGTVGEANAAPGHIDFSEWEMWHEDNERERQRSLVHNPYNYWTIGKSGLDWRSVAIPRA